MASIKVGVKTMAIGTESAPAGRPRRSIWSFDRGAVLPQLNPPRMVALLASSQGGGVGRVATGLVLAGLALIQTQLFNKK